MTTTTKAPLEGDIVLDSLKPPHGKITGFVDLPPGAGSLAGMVEILPLQAGYTLKNNEFAVVTYVFSVQPYVRLDFQTAHFGPGQTIQEKYPIQSGPATTNSLHGGYLVRLK